MSFRRLLGVLLLVVPVSVCAQTDRCALFRAFLNEEMDVWGQALSSCSFAQATTDERLFLLDLEYGYTAYAIQFLEPDTAKRCLERYLSHLELCREWLSDADYWAYMSAAESYALKLDESTVLTHGVRIFRYAKRALEADPFSTLALSVNANVLFYAPKIAGGNKKKASQLYLRAAELFRQQGDTTCNWQYHEALTGIERCKKYTK